MENSAIFRPRDMTSPSGRPSLASLPEPASLPAIPPGESLPGLPASRVCTTGGLVEYLVTWVLIIFIIGIDMHVSWLYG